MTSSGKIHFLPMEQLKKMTWEQKKEYYKQLNEQLARKLDELDDVMKHAGMSKTGPPASGQQ